MIGRTVRLAWSALAVGKEGTVNWYDTYCPVAISDNLIARRIVQIPR